MLSKRLLTIAELISEHDNVADIGADHGKLILYLANKYRNNYFLGIENKLGPFNILKNNLNSSKINNINYKLSDGISYLSENINTLVFAGMGGLNIVSILKKDTYNLKNIDKIVICANNDNFELLKFLHSISYRIIDKKLIIDAKKIYYIFSLKYSSEIIHFSYSHYVNIIFNLANSNKIWDNMDNIFKESNLEEKAKTNFLYYEYSLNYSINYLLEEKLNENKTIIN